MAWVGAAGLGVWGFGRVGLRATGVDIGAVWSGGVGVEGWGHEMRLELVQA